MAARSARRERGGEGEECAMATAGDALQLRGDDGAVEGAGVARRAAARAQECARAACGFGHGVGVRDG